MLVVKLYGDNRERMIDSSCEVYYNDCSYCNVIDLTDFGQIEVSNLEMYFRKDGTVNYDLENLDEETLTDYLRPLLTHHETIIYISEDNPDQDNLKMLLNSVSGLSNITKMVYSVANDDVIDEERFYLESVLSNMGWNNFHIDCYYNVDG